MPYWMPMILWSVEKMYLLPETRLVMLVVAVVVVRRDRASAVAKRRKLLNELFP